MSFTGPRGYTGSSEGQSTYSPSPSLSTPSSTTSTTTNLTPSAFSILGQKRSITPRGRPEAKRRRRRAGKTWEQRCPIIFSLYTIEMTKKIGYI
jgi:hypothetical protein